ncbi:acireductone synthase [Acidobacteria bacterium AB60]|nr:acireductone synthase [Acidobacteria bacterium AB60]
MSGDAPRVYLLDIEGTVAPLSLTSEVLFPYARARLANFLERNRNDDEVRADLVQLARENTLESDYGGPRLTEIQSPEQVTAPRFRLDAMMYLMWLMDRDRKSTALKSLQGKIWKRGFESGELKGTLFQDVPEAFARWAGTGKVAIYSSGSAHAQELLFRHSIFGDLTPLISGYFDTRTGAKGEPESYVAIAKSMEVAPAEVLFISDAVRELDAARKAGCRTRLAVRPGNPPAADPHEHATVETFVEL